MKLRGDGNAVSVGFTGRVARIGRVPQFGLKDRAEPGAPEITHEQRAVLGFSDSNLDLIRVSLLTFLARKLFLKRETAKNIISQPINICITMNPS